MFVNGDRVRQTSLSTGLQQPVVLAANVTGFSPFSILGDGNTTFYCVSAVGGNDWEVRLGAYSAASNSLSCQTVVSSSNGGAPITFAAGVKDVFCTMPASKSVMLDGSNNLSINGHTLSAGGDLTVNATAVVGGTNTGDETVITLGAKISAGAAKPVPVSADSLGVVDSAAGNLLKNLTLGNLATWLVSTVMSFFARGTGAVARTLLAKMRDTVTPYDFGAVGDGATDDTTAVQNFVTYVTSAQVNGDWGDGNYKLTNTVVVQPTAGKWFAFFGRGASSVVTMATDGLAAFEFRITGIGDLSFCSWTRLMTIHFSGSTNVAAVHYHITGDATLFQHMDWSGNTAINGYAVWKDEKLPHVTGFGNEGSMNWNVYTGVRAINVTKYMFWGLNGTGTGNAWNDVRCITSAASSAVFRFEGTNAVVGDVMLNNVHAGCNDAVTGSALVSIGANTNYRAQWSIKNCQWDANCNRVVEMDGTGTAVYTNWNVTGNNQGGSSDLGTSLQPMSRSVVEDRHVSRWEAGVDYSTSATGANTLDCFELTFNDYGAAWVTLTTYGLIGGIAAYASEAVFHVRADNASSFGTLFELTQGEDSQLSWTYTNTGTKKGKFTVTYTPAAGGSEIEATLMARGTRFKARRMVLN